MRVNDGITTGDKLKPYAPLIIFGIVVAFASFIALLNNYSKSQHAIEQSKIAFELQQKKVNQIQTNKFPLVCKGQYFDPTQYDVVAMEGKIIVETITSIGKPKDAIPFSECQVYEKLTSSIVPPKPLTMTERVAQKIKELERENNSLKMQVANLDNQRQSLEESNHRKSTEITNMIALVKDKQTKIDELSGYAAKYKEVKELLEIALGAESKRFSKFLAGLDKPKPEENYAMKKEETQTIIQAQKALKPLNIKPVEYADLDKTNPEIQIKLRLYTMKELSGKLGKKTPPTDFKKPNLDDLKSFKVSKKQLDNYEQTVTVLDRSIKSLALTLSRVTKTDVGLIEASIYENVVDISGNNV